jgi:uncharacterized protein (DUF779 family)
MQIEITEKAKEVIHDLRKSYPNLSMVIESTSCCSNSSIFVRDNPPTGDIIFLKELEGVKIYLDPSLKSLLNFNHLIIDVIDFTDDSLSLETNLNKRFILIAKKN